MANMDNQWSPQYAGVAGQQFPQQPPPQIAGAQVPGGVPPGTAPGQPYQLNEQQAQAATALPSQKMQEFQLARQYKLADALRADAKNQMQGKMVGRVYVGPKWWDAAASVGNDYLAMNQDLAAQKSAKDYTNAVGASALDMLRKKGLLAPSTQAQDDKAQVQDDNAQ